MKPIKQTVYVPVNGDYITAVCTYENEWVHQETVIDKEGYFFTPEQLNEYTTNVIKQTLEIAAENAAMKDYKEGDWDVCWICNDTGDSYVLDKQSIINTFDEIFKQFEV